MIFNERLSRRQMLTGAAGIGAAAALGGGLVYAQSATPGSTPSSGTSGASGSTTTETNAQKRYTDFVDKLAANLGNLEPAKVDAAIRTSLKQMVDDAYKAGNISANEATAIKNRIDASTFPADLGPLFRGRRGPGGMPGIRRRRLEGGGNFKNRKKNNEINKGNQPVNNNATPAATPSTT